MVWLDGSFLVIGGAAEPPGNTGEEQNRTGGQRDDPESDTWHAIASAPAGFDQFDSHVVLGDVLYVVTEELEDAREGSDGGPWVCADQALYSYDLSADAWSELPLPAGNCSLSHDGLVATSDAVIALDAGWMSSWDEEDPRWEATYPRAVDAVYRPEQASWEVRHPPAEVARADSFRWGTWTGDELLVTVEQLPRGSFSTFSTATPAVYAWDYHADSWHQVDQPGSDSLDWTNWTGRIQDPTGPIYYQDGELLAFDRTSGTFRRTQALCGSASCADLGAGMSSYFGTGVSDLGVFVDGWTLSSSTDDRRSVFLLRPETGETISLVTPQPPDPNRDVLDRTSVAGGPGRILSCPITPSWLPDGDFIDDLTPPIADLTLGSNAGAGEPGALVRVTVRDDYAEDPHALSYEVLAVDAEGIWTYSDGHSGPDHSTVLNAEYLHKQDMQPYCYLLRH